MTFDALTSFGSTAELNHRAKQFFLPTALFWSYLCKFADFCFQSLDYFYERMQLTAATNQEDSFL